MPYLKIPRITGLPGYYAQQRSVVCIFLYRWSCCKQVVYGSVSSSNWEGNLLLLTGPTSRSYKGLIFKRLLWSRHFLLILFKTVTIMWLKSVLITTFQTSSLSRESFSFNVSYSKDIKRPVDPSKTPVGRRYLESFSTCRNIVEIESELTSKEQPGTCLVKNNLTVSTIFQTKTSKSSYLRSHKYCLVQDG